MHPAQFDDIWNGKDSNPLCALAAAVMGTAVADLREQGYVRRRSRLYQDAYEWMTSTDREWPFSFVNLCDCLGLSPDVLRARLLPVDGGRAKAEAV